MGAGSFGNGLRYALPGTIIGGASGAATADDGTRMGGAAMGAGLGALTGMAGGRLAHRPHFDNHKISRRLLKMLTWLGAGGAGGLANAGQATDNEDLARRLLHGMAIGGGARAGHELGRGVGALVGGPFGGAVTGTMAAALGEPLGLLAGNEAGKSLADDGPKDKRVLNERQKTLMALLTGGSDDDGSAAARNRR